MLNRKTRVLTIACGCAVAMLAMPAMGTAGIFTSLFGPAPCAAPTYAPVVAAPACGSCAPQTVGYMPTSVYRAFYQPAAPMTYPTYTAGYAVTTYRPLFGGWAYRAPLLPYTTYRPVYTAMPVVAYAGCTTCANYSPCDSCSPCGGSCGAVTYAPPTSGCASCATPATVVTPAPYSGGTEAPPPRTFQEKVERPATEEIKPIPRTDGQLNSLPAPLLPDPSARTAARWGSSSARVVLTASPVQDDGWQPARD